MTFNPGDAVQVSEWACTHACHQTVREMADGRSTIVLESYGSLRGRVGTITRRSRLPSCFMVRFGSDPDRLMIQDHLVEAPI